MEVNQQYENIPVELKHTLENHHRDFQEIPKRLPPFTDHGHEFEFIPRSTPPKKRPHRYPHQRKGEIEKTVEDTLDEVLFDEERDHFQP
jgi:hypothetical protein